MMNRFRVLLSLLCCSLALPVAHAQSTTTSSANGLIEGRILDKATREGVFGAMVIAAGTDRAAPADAEGRYHLPLPAGTYTIKVASVGFKSQDFPNTRVGAGQTTMLDVTMIDQGTQLGTVSVVGQKQTGTEVGLITDLKKSEVVVSGISSEQIVKSQDRDASEVVKRIPGVTIQDSRFILVRGLAERYNTVMLNDAIAPSSEADVRAFSFDALPSAAIDRILIYKSAAPELPGDFAGGVVKVYTRNSAAQNATVVAVSGGHRLHTTFSKLLTSAHSGTDFLGFDNGLRSMPGAFPKSLGDLPVQERVEASRQLSSNWSPQQRTAAPDLRLSLGVTRVFDWGATQITTVTAAMYSNTYEQVAIKRFNYENFDPALGRSTQQFAYADQRGTQNTRLGVVHNWAARFNNRNKIEFRNLFNQLGSNQVSVRRGFNYGEFNEVGEAVGLRYESRSMYSGQLQGTHDLADDRTTLTWTAGYAYTNRSQPDYRQYAYSRPLDSPTAPFTINIGNSPNPRAGGRFFSDLNEHTVMSSGQWERKFGADTLDADARPKLRAGFYAEQKNRDFAARWPAYVPARFDTFNAELLKLPIDQIFAPENINSTTGFALSEISKPSYKYQASNTLVAGYVGGVLPVGPHLNLTGGVRVETYRQYLKSGKDSGPVKVDTLQLAVLPSVNATWNFTKKSLVRVASSVTVNRPEFRELAPFNFYDFDQNAEIQGNPALKPARIYNADVRYEFYPTPGEIVSLGVFGKQFVNPIEKLVLPSGSPIYNFQNTRSAWSAGLELEARQTFAQLSPSPVLQRLGLTLNASLIASRVRLNEAQSRIQQSSRPLQGQSPYIINTGLFYQDDESGWLATLLYNVAGPRIFAVGAISQDPDIYEMPRHQVDFTVGKRFGQHLEVKGGVQDLLNQRVRLVQDTDTNGKITGVDEDIASFRRGQYSSLSVTYRF